MNIELRRNLLLRVFLAVLLFVLASGTLSAQDANDLLRRIDESLLPNSYEAYRTIVNEEPNGSKKEFSFFTIKKGKDKIAMLYLAPASEKGRATLRVGENMWLYIPNVNKPVRITSLQSVTGGVFNNADIMQLEYAEEYNASLAGGSDEETILDLKAKSPTVAYDRLKMWVTKDGTSLRKVEAYSASGMLIKTLEFKQMKDFGNGLVRPSIIETYSPLYKGYRSLLTYRSIKSRSLPDEAFTLNFMGRLGSLR